MATQVVRNALPKPVQSLLRSALRPIRVAWLRRKHVGKRTFIHHTVQVLGWSGVRVGHDSALSEGVWLNVNKRDVQYGILIGDHCLIGRRNFFSSGQTIQVGSYVMTGLDVRLLGASHVLSSPYIPYLISEASYDGDIVIGTNCWLSDSVIVLGGVTIGHGSLIGAGALVTKSIPPFSIAVGNPCRVIKRYDFLSQQYVALKNWTDDLEQAIPSEESYLQRLEQDYPSIRAQRIHAGPEFSN